MGCSLGFAQVDLKGGRTFEEIIAEADARMYEEKRLRKLARDVKPPEEHSASLDSFAWY